MMYLRGTFGGTGAQGHRALLGCRASVGDLHTEATPLASNLPLLHHRIPDKEIPPAIAERAASTLLYEDLTPPFIRSGRQWTPD